jgi:hypothetical protein
VSVRDDPVLFLQPGKKATGGTVLGGNAIATTKVHRLDGPEHEAADDTTRLDATVDEHGLLPKLSGDPEDALRGDGTWSPPGGGVTVEDEGTPLATTGTTLDFVGAAIAATGTGATKTVTVTAELPSEGGQSLIKAHGAMGSTETFDPTDGNVHTGTLNANCTFTLSAPAGSGAALLELWLTQDATGGRTVTWPGSVTLQGTLDTTANTTSRVLLDTIDGGTNWIATVVGSATAAPATADYLVGTAQAGLSAEIVVGTTPGGELGGTWASPTVDSVHSGSAHIALSSATPLVESGSGSAGSGTAASKDDHVHPAAASSSSTSGSDHEHMVDVFAGDGSTTAFEITDEPLDPEAVVAFVAGAETAVTMSGTMNTTATFGVAPSAAARVVITYPAVAA